MTDSTARASAKPTVSTQPNAPAGKQARPAPQVAPATNDLVGILYNSSPAVTLGALVQRKVVIGAPNDPFEREADAAAERVTAGRPVQHISRLPAAGLASVMQRMADEAATDDTDLADETRNETGTGEEEPAQTLALQREPVDEEEEPAQTLAVQRQSEVDEHEEPVQSLSDGFGGPSMRSAAAAAIRGKGAGEPLRPAVRGTLERGMGVDLGDVRVHASASAARSLHARAFTHRNHIWLGSGESQADLKLLAHETTHVLQQDGVVRRKPVAEQMQTEDREEDVNAVESTAQAPAVVSAQPGQAPAAGALNGASPATPVAQEAATPQAAASAEPAGRHEDPESVDAAAAESAKEKQAATAGQPPAQPGEAAEAPEKSPSSPAEDPQFQKTLGKIKKTRKAQGSHAPAEEKKGEVTSAAVLPAEEQKERNARSDHLTSMESTAEETEKKEESKPSFSPESFKELLKGNLAEIERTLPQSESEAEDFKRDKPLEGVKQNIGGQVATENARMTGPMASQVKQDAPPSAQPVEKPDELQEEKPGENPEPISAKAAAPKPMLDSEVSMARESQSLDDKMAEEGLTEEQLAESNEPNFVEALDSKRQAQQEATAAPGRYREKEEKILAGAQGRARSGGQAGFAAMHGSRTAAFTGVFAKQASTETTDKKEQKRILGELERIYNATKTDVDTLLRQLSTDVDTTFETEAGVAKKTFEDQVEEKLDDIYGITVVDDWIFGEDTEAIEEVFREEKERFLSSMDRTLDKIAELIAAQLNAAIDRIKQGRKEADDFYNGLSQEQQRLATEAMEIFKAQYDTLEESVNEKQQELAQALAESYKSNVDSLRESFDKIKEEVSRGWIGKAIDFIVDVATAIKKLGELLLSIISRIADLIGDILAHPIRFLENLASGVAAGFAKFIGNLDVYLISGFFDWLRGSVGGAAIEMPKEFDPKGLFGLVTQVLAVDYQMFRKLASRKLGEGVVSLLEQGSELVAPGLEIFQLVRTQGLGALWDHIKEMVGNNLSEVFDQVKQTVLYQTIEKVLAFVAGLFTPAGAFVKAAQTLYRGLRFLVDNIDRIAELVNAFLDALTLAVAGNVSGISEKIVLALKNVIVVAIDFLAKLVGLGNLGDKVRRILKTLRQPIVRAMGWFLDKIKAVLRRVLGKGKGAGKLPTKDAAVREKRKQQAVRQVQKAMERGIPRPDLVSLLKQLKRDLSLKSARLDQDDDVTIENSSPVKLLGVSYDLRVTKGRTAGKRTKSERGTMKLGQFSATGKNLPTARGVLEKSLVSWPYPEMPADAIRPQSATGSFTGKLDAIDRVADTPSMLYTAEYGNVEARLRDRYFTFDSGHLIANEFGGRESEENIVPMKPKFNQGTGAFRKLENWVRSLLPDAEPTQQNVAVTMTVSPSYPGPVKGTLSQMAKRINSRLKAIGFQKEATESKGGTFGNRRKVELDSFVRSKPGYAETTVTVPARIPRSFTAAVEFSALVDAKNQLDPAEQVRVDDIAAGTGLAQGAQARSPRIIVMEKAGRKKKASSKSATQVKRVNAKKTFVFPHYNP